jgi:hypothetical protein
VLLLPSTFQQVFHQRPLQSGVCAAPLGIGALLIVPIARRFVDKRGPAVVVLTGITLSALGFGDLRLRRIRAGGICADPADGVDNRWIGHGQRSAADVGGGDGGPQIGSGGPVNLQVAASVGAALVSVIASSQFNRGAYITAANKLAILQHTAVRRGVPLDPSAIPPQIHAPDFASTVLHVPGVVPFTGRAHALSSSDGSACVY